MKRNILYITCLFLILLGISCSDTIPVSKETSEKPVLLPDYADVTIPYNIAPLNFKIENPHAEAFAVLKFGEEKIQVKEKGGQFYLPASDWRKLLKRATGKAIQVKLYAKDKECLSGILTIRRSGTHGFISGLSLDRTRIRTLESNGYLPTESGRL